ncbi:F-box protein PP2-B1-like, partial [Actinidia eriantha]|uniref:F-box protein PP2-B1-like n=1 Tax=Actinidia eriantha TaxID=165200 RepID=UPI0025899E57
YVVAGKEHGWINFIWLFKKAANAHSVQESVNTLDYKEIIKRSVSPVVFSTDKELYFRLCDFPILLDGGKMSFALDKRGGKKCYMLGARQLSIASGDNTSHWKWTSHVDSRFLEVAELLRVNWLEIQGKIDTRFLSSKTTYGAYLVFKIAEESSGLESVPLKASVRFVGAGGGGAEIKSCDVYVESKLSSDVPTDHDGRLPRWRKDGWMEIELGDFFIDQGDDAVEMRVMEIEHRREKSGLIVEGIELRPKADDHDELITTLWEEFLPSDYPYTIAKSATPLAPTHHEFFKRLCNTFTLLDGGTMSFALDRQSGKRCYMLGERGLSIAWGNNTDYWKWVAHPDSRFSEVAQLSHVFWLEIGAKMSTRMLSPKTTYVAYLVFKDIPEEFSGFNGVPIKASVGYVGKEGVGARHERVVYLESNNSLLFPVQIQDQLPYGREDGWMEIKMGEIFIDLADDGKVEMLFKEVERLGPKSGLIIQGIELRPKMVHNLRVNVNYMVTTQ